MCSMQHPKKAGDLGFQRLSFPIDLYWNDCNHFLFTFVFNCHLSVVFPISFSLTLEYICIKYSSKTR